MRFFLAMILIVCLGLLAGAGSALVSSGLVPGIAYAGRGVIDVAGWRGDFDIGAPQANPWTRARVARHGLLALAKSEAVYFTRNTDQDGRRLSETCVYRVSGQDQDALWWSLTLYDAESRLPMNTDNALSYDRTRAGEGKSWSVLVQASAPGSAPWISSRGAGDFDLTLRLYRPSARILEGPSEALSPPRVERLACAGEPA